jgi:hypothetical protein
VSIALATYQGEALTDAARPIALTPPFAYSAKVPAKATKVRAIVMDGELQAVGSVTVRVR